MAIPIGAARRQHYEFLDSIIASYATEVGEAETEKVILQFKHELAEWIEKRRTVIDVRALCAAVGFMSDEIIANIIHEIKDTRPQ